MIAYLDTSALVKLFFLEAGSELVIDLVKKADSVITSQVTYAESCAALARRKREKRLTAREFQRARKNLEDLWPEMNTILVAELRAGELAIKHVIRGFDAIHLAAAMEIRTNAGKDIDVLFCSFDNRQNEAARNEGLAIIDPKRA